ncbi:hypothetical protein BDZ91DRAFT_798533 [Kalaharituber pfeilii]|nr:hypothetical protein BDZ91DRAFT_798533 [Kalaharituber pfeilii]
MGENKEERKEEEEDEEGVGKEKKEVLVLVYMARVLDERADRLMKEGKEREAKRLEPLPDLLQILPEGDAVYDDALCGSEGGSAGVKTRESNMEKRMGKLEGMVLEIHAVIGLVSVKKKRVLEREKKKRKEEKREEEKKRKREVEIQKIQKLQEETEKRKKRKEERWRKVEEESKKRVAEEWRTQVVERVQVLRKLAEVIKMPAGLQKELAALEEK